MENKIATLILAAGFSSRMGVFKPLLPFGEKTALECVLDTLKNASIHNVVVVIGYQYEKLKPVIDKYGFKSCYNPIYPEGMFTSIQAGVSMLFSKKNNENSENNNLPCGFFLSPVDCPLVPVEVYKILLEKINTFPNKMIVPCYQGKKGHPLFIPSSYVDEILSHDGRGGLKYITDQHQEELLRIDVPYESILLDMDTYKDYKELVNFSEGRDQEFSITKDRKIHLIRHGQIRQHREPIFIGQANIPLSDLGKEQANDAGKVLKKIDSEIKTIYSSDLDRAKETAEIITYQYPHQVDILYEPAFREMALGDWDGHFISEIKKKFPEEYERRGKHLLIYKKGNRSENFYDLQYRVMKKLKELLRETEDDIVIVTHMGVIKVIYANLLGIPLENVLKMKVDNGQVLTIRLKPEGCV